MRDSKKQNISIRMSTSDLQKVKCLAKKFQVRESDVYRFAIRSALAKLAPLHEEYLSGQDLLPVFMELGPELTNYFDLDSSILNSIINGNVEGDENRVDQKDIDLLAISGSQENYVLMKLKAFAIKNGDTQGTAQMIKQYLLEKYVSPKSLQSSNESVAIAKIEPSLQEA